MAPFFGSGVAFDGSPWVNAASSSALVLGTAASAAIGAVLMKRGITQGLVVMETDDARSGRRVKPLEKSGGTLDMSQATEKAPEVPGLDPEDVLESNAGGSNFK
mmetsp:Transcript_11864/g.28174  ORF Transcript_11864/g.28174 Transcript_11864/m.28174 type:complete len:104 (+) Transcript_11864:90-401(+)